MSSSLSTRKGTGVEFEEILERALAGDGLSVSDGERLLRAEGDEFRALVAAADELAAAASLVMGEAAEGTPAVHVRGFPYPLREGSLKEILRPKEQDLFR